MINTFWLVLGYGCNNRCGGCYAGGKGFTSRTMPIRYAKEVIETMASLKANKCLLIGGEPTLHPDLPKIISNASLNGISTTLITNGRRLSRPDYLETLLQAGLNKIVISIESANAEIHNQMTGAKSHHETLQAIRNCVRLRCNLCTLTTIGGDNRSSCQELPQALHDLGVKEIAFNCAIPPVSRNPLALDEIIQPDLIAETILATYTKASMAGIPVNFNTTIPLCLLPKEMAIEMDRTGSLSVGCQMYHSRGAAFDPSGDILPCTHLAEHPILHGCMNQDGSFNLRDSFLSVWDDQGGPPQRFRNKLWRYPSSLCQRCTEWGNCIGGCPLFWTALDPRKFIRPTFQKERR